jgi:hypothetical protein
VIAGKSVLEFRRNDTGQNKSSKCFGFVQNYDDRPKRRLFEVLKSQGMQENQQVVFLSDGRGCAQLAVLLKSASRAPA